MTKFDTDVLIVGAGPTGLALATRLQMAGVDHVLLDAQPQGSNTSRAAVVHAHTLEMLEVIGVVDQLKAEGLRLGKFTVRDRDSALLELDFDWLPSAYPYTLMIPQNRTEAILTARLLELGGSIQREHRVLRVSQDGDGVTVTVQCPTGERSIRSRYVVGADGMHSIVRQSAAIEFEGATYGESFVLADVRMDWPLGRDEVSLLFSPDGLVVVAPLPDGSTRIVATVETAPEHPSIEFIQQLLDARGPISGTAKVHSLTWSTRFRVHHRLASTYRHARLVVMGDAAHVHSPAGGQGMNTGLVDAMVLGQALTEAVHNGRDAALDRYAEVRRPAAKQVLALASRLTRLAVVRSPVLRRLRNAMLRVLNAIGPFKRRLSLDLSGISRRSRSVLNALDGSGDRSRMSAVLEAVTAEIDANPKRVARAPSAP
ncbi:MAG: FAD-dependent oxidoreductase [Sphingomicrobium sp.]